MTLWPREASRSLNSTYHVVLGAREISFQEQLEEQLKISQDFFDYDVSALAGLWTYISAEPKVQVQVMVSEEKW